MPLSPGSYIALTDCCLLLSDFRLPKCPLKLLPRYRRSLFIIKAHLEQNRQRPSNNRGTVHNNNMHHIINYKEASIHRNAALTGIESIHILLWFQSLEDAKETAEERVDNDANVEEEGFDEVEGTGENSVNTLKDETESNVKLVNQVGDARNVDEFMGDLLDDADVYGLNNVREGLSNGLLVIVTTLKHQYNENGHQRKDLRNNLTTQIADVDIGVGAGASGNIYTELVAAPVKGINNSIEAGLNISLRITGHGSSGIL